MELLKRLVQTVATAFGRTVIRTRDFEALRHLEQLPALQTLLLRHQIASKWEVLDVIERDLNTQIEKLVCPLCGYGGYSVFHETL